MSETAPGVESYEVRNDLLEDGSGDYEVTVTRQGGPADPASRTVRVPAATWKRAVEEAKKYGDGGDAWRYALDMMDDEPNAVELVP